MCERGAHTGAWRRGEEGKGGKAAGGCQRHRKRGSELTWPLCCVGYFYSSPLVSADVGSLEIFNKALIPTVIEPLVRLI